ncbi:hypothetical protein JRI60_00200 [Archangium violaceum]|uniref:hypothetical protein n=1 Tax=Archangium violaceum TaxID=83451 RepID=UPI00194E5932|nr:hypothetical protein [Archangium violaceum]QRN97552.1 hypothetical protein JRI60_00200 [Archangium violaceum]
MSAEDESKVEWETPPRARDAVSGRLISGVIAGALIIFTFFVVSAWAQLQEREKHLSPAGPSEPQELGKAEINIVNTGLFQLDTRAYEETNEQRRRLHEYGWVDRDGGVVHIPIERAIERVVGAQQGRDGGGR